MATQQNHKNFNYNKNENIKSKLKIWNIKAKYYITKYKNYIK